MQNITNEEMEIYQSLLDPKKLDETSKRLDHAIDNYKTEEYFKLAHVKRSQLFHTIDQFKSVMTPTLLNEINKAQKGGLLASTVLGLLTAMDDLRVTLPLKAIAGDNGKNISQLSLIMSLFKYDNHGGRIFTIRDSLLDKLLATSVGDKTPLEFLRLPYNNIYLEFGDKRNDRGIYLHDNDTGDHIVEGAYISESSTHHEEMLRMAGEKELYTFKKLGIDPNQPMRVLQITYTGSPIGKSSPIDDTFIHVYIYIPTESKMDTKELIKKHIEYYRGEFSLSTGEYRFNQDQPAMNRDNVKMFYKLFNLVAVSLLYLNSDKPVLMAERKHSSEMKRVNQLSPKKRRKAVKRATVLVDRTYVGEREGLRYDSTYDRKPVSMHWRRGHYRTQKHGKNYSETKLLWIKPTLVGSSDADKPSIKNYDIK